MDQTGGGTRGREPPKRAVERPARHAKAPCKTHSHRETLRNAFTLENAKERYGRWTAPGGRVRTLRESLGGVGHRQVVQQPALVARGHRPGELPRRFGDLILGT